MICGAGTEHDVTRGEQRRQLLNERDDRIAQFMKEGLSVAHIAELEGLTVDRTRKETTRISREREIDYNPPKNQTTPVVLTDASRALRNRLADVVYRIRNKPGQHPLAIARETGLTQEQQKLACERGGQVDMKISQLERIAVADGQDFTRMMLKSLLSPEEYQKVIKCLNN